MLALETAFARLEPVLYEQDGFVTSWQARELGCASSTLSRLMHEGHLMRLRRGVYQSAWGHPIMPRVDADLYADYLAIDGRRMPWDRSDVQLAVSHSSAALLLRLGTLPADIHEFTSAVRLGVSLPSIKMRVAPLPGSDWEWRFGRRIPVTRAGRTIVDLALAGVGTDYVRRMLDEARVRHMITGTELLGVIERRATMRTRSLVEWIPDAFAAIDD